jgi:hypothetical protein
MFSRMSATSVLERLQKISLCMFKTLMSFQNEGTQKFNFVISTNTGELYSGSFGVQW